MNRSSIRRSLSPHVRPPLARGLAWLETGAGRARARVDRGGGATATDRYRGVWRPGTESDAMDLILTTRDAAAFEREGERTAAHLAAYCSADTVALDLGAGIGRVARHLAPHVREIVLVDISEEMLGFARQRLAGAPNARFVASSVVAVPAVADGSIDFLYSLLVLQHLEREDAFLALEEIRRMLAPDGRACLTFPNLLEDVHLASFTAYAHGNETANPGRARFYTPQEVERIVAAAGFVVEGLEAGPEIVVVLRAAGA